MLACLTTSSEGVKTRSSMRMLSVFSKLRLLLMPVCPPNFALKIQLHVNSTIDVEHLTRDIVTVHNKVADSTSYFLGSPNSTERYPFQDHLFYFFRNTCKHVCLYETRTDNVGRHIVTSQFKCCRLCETDDTSLSCRIVGLTEIPHLTNKGTDIDNFAAFLPYEIRLRCLYSVETAVQVSLNYCVPVLHRKILHRPINVYASIIDKYVNLAKLMYGIFYE